MFEKFTVSELQALFEMWLKFIKLIFISHFTFLFHFFMYFFLFG